MKRIFFPFLVLLLLSACGTAPAPAAQTPTSEVSPTPIATLTPTPTPTPTPLKPEDLLDQATYDTLTSYGFHFVDRGDGKIKIYYQNNFSYKLVGYLAQDGLHFAATEFQAEEDADGQMVDATRKTSAEENVFAIGEKSESQVFFDIAPTKNPLFEKGILTMRQKEIGANGEEREVVYVFDNKHGEFVRKVEMGKDIEQPSYYGWDYEEVVVASAILSGLDKPFPEEVVENAKGGWAMYFEHDEKTDSSDAYLQIYGLHPHSNRWALDDEGKPAWFTTIAPDGTVYQSILTQLFNPQDMKNPKADETLLVLGTAGEWWNGETRAEFIRNYVDRPDGKYPPFWEGLLPQLVLCHTCFDR